MKVYNSRALFALAERLYFNLMYLRLLPQACAKGAQESTRPWCLIMYGRLRLISNKLGKLFVFLGEDGTSFYVYLFSGIYLIWTKMYY